MKTRLAITALVLVLATAVAVTGVGAAPTARIRTEVPAAGMSLALPATWRLVDARTAGRLAKETLAKENPQLASILAELDRPGTGLVFFAFDPNGAEKFATNVNIVVSEVPNGVTVSQLMSASKRELSRIPGRVGPVTSSAVLLPGGLAAGSRVDIAVKTRGKPLIARVMQYAWLRPGHSVVVSFTTRRSTYPQYRPVFIAAARSVRFG